MELKEMIEVRNSCIMYSMRLLELRGGTSTEDVIETAQKLYEWITVTQKTK